ncbi:Flp pilus assembly complex ATPase component TadA [Candidatus Saccharibacteria bacterium]|nr:Flp pilus assembly complex ATPase component TadA [Candidatus Saccharibacteria bacterium]MCL1963065.1 Flp pilus assembly complex ATPase component TadA [Candidatus Saccharibacteria bacterium]
MDEAERQRRFRDADEKNTEKRAVILGVHYIDMRGREDDMPLVDGIMSIHDMYHYRMIPLEYSNELNRTTYGITLSTPETRLKELGEEAEQTAAIVSFNLISDSAFRALMKRYDPPKEVHYENVEITDEDMTSNTTKVTISEVSENLNQVRSDDILSYLVFQADSLGASDIHLENQRNNVRVRLRIDGALHEIADISHDKYRELFFAIASAANLSTASKEAQSGHIVREITLDDAKKFGEDVDEETYQNHTLNMRIETVPTSYGQDAVIRLFNFSSEMLKMDVLGLSDDERAELDKVVSHPNGMVLVVGPTGAGKSTTLYSIINALNDPSRKILTLEDPVEFDIPGVVQVPIDTTHDQSFADNVRTILRLDPDIVMVGEIRDPDTAHAAIQAAITGHLLLATLHANDAAAAFARIIDMIGVNPVFATSIRLVIGQRLVRRLDDATKIEYEPTDAEKKYISDVLADLPETFEKPDLENIRLWKPGKSEENPFGYRGRIVLMEQLIVNDRIAGFLRGDALNISAKEIARVAHDEGMVTMLQKGILKCLSGETTLSEINRVL